MYAVVGASDTLAWRVVEALLTEVTGDEIAFLVPDAERFAAYATSRNVDVRGDEDDGRLDDAEVVVLLGPDDGSLVPSVVGRVVTWDGGPTVSVLRPGPADLDGGDDPLLAVVAATLADRP
ncbi:hypothetical protein [Actinomycetospora termitidis]|uniref:Uncharacterized protein n=1 Tax=Actinomycetospora termitidis TaxID=3053470 RepID=A0ABT7MBR8_9PSEU|nr:hypothetical protein [Actinomycetospora sp. Odt1-22]MDL5158121.1 hypothetical protein [Actinomycetospora sp. Odt1-22]